MSTSKIFGTGANAAPTTTTEAPERKFLGLFPLRGSRGSRDGGQAGPVPEASAPPPPDDAAAVAEAAPAEEAGRSLASAAWFASEADRLCAQAQDADRRGAIPEAVLYYRRVVSKVEAASEACPEGHADCQALLDFAEDVKLRLLYLEGLCGAKATTGPDEHISSDLKSVLTMDLSAAVMPAEHGVGALLAQTGITGESAELTVEGFRLVVAMDNSQELEAFLRRAVESWGLEPRPDVAPAFDMLATMAEAMDVSDAGALQSVEKLARSAVWLRDPHAEARAAEAERLRIAEAEAAAAAAAEAERLRVAAAEAAEAAAAAERQRLQEQAAAAAAARKELEKDKLNWAIALEREGREFEAQGRNQEALHRYVTCSHAFSYVYKFDPRAKNSEKVKETVRQRLETVLAKCEELKARGVPMPVVPGAS